MKKTIKNSIILLGLWLSATHSNAQLGGMLRDLQGLADRAKQAQQTQQIPANLPTCPQDELKQNCAGDYVSPSGRKFTAVILNGRIQARSPDGSSLEGDFNGRHLHGIGISRLPDGRVYTGEWQNGLPHGNGIIQDSSGKTLAQGRFEAGNIVDPAQRSSGVLNQSQSGQAQSSPSTSATSRSPMASMGQNLIDGYCERINQDKNIPQIVDLLQKIEAVGGGLDFNKYFISHSLDVQRWVSQNLDKQLGLRLKTGYESKHPRSAMIADLASKINSCMSAASNGPLGVFVKALPYSKPGSPITYNTSSSFSSIELDTPSNLFLLGFMFDGFVDFLMSLEPNNPFQKMYAELAQRKKYAESQQAKVEKSKKEDEERAASEKKLAELLAAAKAYLDTPDGRLVWGYQHFQLIQVCYDLRKDFAVKFISASDHSDYRAKIRALESKLKPSLTQKNTDLLFARAEERNRRYQPFYPTIEDKVNGIDLFKFLTESSKGSQWMEAKKSCDNISATFRQIISDNLGAEPVKKTF